MFKKSTSPRLIKSAGFNDFVLSNDIDIFFGDDFLSKNHISWAFCPFFFNAHESSVNVRKKYTKFAAIISASFPLFQI